LFLNEFLHFFLSFPGGTVNCADTVCIIADRYGKILDNHLLHLDNADTYLEKQMAIKLTKSKFKLALECPTKLYYIGLGEQWNSQLT